MESTSNCDGWTDARKGIAISFATFGFIEMPSERMEAIKATDRSRRIFFIVLCDVFGPKGSSRLVAEFQRLSV